MKKLALLLSILSVFLLFLTAGCHRQQPAVEQPPQTSQSAPAPVKPEVVTADPQLSEVEAAVKRVFNDTAAIHPEYKTSFLTADFNGDLSQDLAVVIKPAPDKLAEMNESPRWLLRDPRASQNPQTPLRIEKDEPLLAVIHGYGTNAWRDPEATQTFLLKHVAGTNMHVQNGAEFLKTNHGKTTPRVHGDLIAEKLKGSEGYLYYNAANYYWYDPKTFKGETETTAGMFHGRKSTRR